MVAVASEPRAVIRVRVHDAPLPRGAPTVRKLKHWCSGHAAVACAISDASSR
jgi:hypothetical protein